MTKTTKKQTKKNAKKPINTPPRMSKAKPPKPAPLVPGPGEIVVTNGHGPQLVKAEKLHDFFALHAPVDTKHKGHVLTHVPTGRKVSTYRTRLLAMWVAQQLRAIGGAELWQFTDPNHMLKHAPKDVLDKLRRLADPATAEQDMRQAHDPGGAAISTRRPTREKLGTAIPRSVPTADPANPPKYSAPWRSGIDWVAAGKKAYETRQRNIAARAAEAAAAAAAAQPAPVKRRAGARA